MITDLSAEKVTKSGGFLLERSKAEIPNKRSLDPKLDKK